jgi:hypothetical protein
MTDSPAVNCPSSVLTPTTDSQAQVLKCTHDRQPSVLTDQVPQRTHKPKVQKSNNDRQPNRQLTEFRLNSDNRQPSSSPDARQEQTAQCSHRPSPRGHTNRKSRRLPTTDSPAVNCPSSVLTPTKDSQAQVKQDSPMFPLHHKWPRTSCSRSVQPKQQLALHWHSPNGLALLKEKEPSLNKRNCSTALLVHRRNLLHAQLALHESSLLTTEEKSPGELQQQFTSTYQMSSPKMVIGE